LIDRTWPLCTAASVDQPGRTLTVSRDCLQQIVSASRIRSGFALMIVSAESCGYPKAFPLTSDGSAMFVMFASVSTDPMKVFDVTE